MLDFVIGITITDDINIARQIQSLKLFRFSLVHRKRIFLVEACDPPVAVKRKLVGKYVLWLDSKFGYHGLDEFAKAIGDDVDVV